MCQKEVMHRNMSVGKKDHKKAPHGGWLAFRVFSVSLTLVSARLDKWETSIFGFIHGRCGICEDGNGGDIGVVQNGGPAAAQSSGGFSALGLVVVGGGFSGGSGVFSRASRMARSKEKVPDSTERGKGVVASFVAFVMVVVVVGLLREREPVLCGVNDIDWSGHSAVLLQRFADSQNPRHKQHFPGKRKKNLGGDFRNQSVGEIVEPVVFVCSASQRCFSVVVERMDVLPQELVGVEVSMDPVHSERENVVVPDETGQRRPGRLGFDWRIECLRHGEVKEKIHRKVRDQGQAIVEVDRGELVSGPTGDVLRFRSNRLLCGLRAKLGKPKVHVFEMPSVCATNNARQGRNQGKIGESHR